MRTWFETVLVVAVTLAAVSSSVAVEVRAKPSSSAIQVYAQPNAQLLQGLAQPVGRQALVQALLANPRTRSAISREAAKYGAGQEQVSAVATKPLQLKLSAQAASSMAGNAEYAKLDWTKGFTFKPFALPEYGGQKWKLGAYDLRNVSLRTWESDVVSMDIPAYGPPEDIGALYLELPQEPALYAVLVRLTGEGYKAYDGWITPAKAGDVPGLLVYFHRLDGSGFLPSQIPLTLMPDAKGFAGVFSSSPVSSVEGASRGMRTVNAAISMKAITKNAKPYYSMRSLHFAGITITKL